MESTRKDLAFSSPTKIKPVTALKTKFGATFLLFGAIARSYEELENWLYKQMCCENGVKTIKFSIPCTNIVLF